MRWTGFCAIVIGCIGGHVALADVTLPALFTDHMVLQREQENRIWGEAEPGEEVTVKIADQEHNATADDAGRWEITLTALPAGGPHQLEVAGKNKLTIDDVLVGEVWLCSGQSNMEWPIKSTNDGDLETLLSENPQLRFISVPRVGTQQPQRDFKGKWEVCSPTTLPEFSAVGYFFGKQLQETLGVPVGLIDNAWGGSACEAWIDRELLAEQEQFKPLTDAWSELEKTFDFKTYVEEYKKKKEAWEAGGKQGPGPRWYDNPLEGNSRPGNLYNGVLLPVAGYGIRGAIWYQGETNAGRAYQYRELFPLMIRNWRDLWQQGDFPFYWVQLADYMAEKPEPSGSAWAELREAQTLTLDKLPHVGQAVIIDLGEGRDIHPRNKRDVALRLARIALARDYGKDVLHQAPRYKSHHIDGSKVTITFDMGDDPGGKLRPFDRPEPVGFTIAGEDRQFVRANAKLLGHDKVEVWSDSVPTPVAVRYAWADNPVCNLKNEVGLPVTPFRTDKWPGITANAHVPPLLTELAR